MKKGRHRRYEEARAFKRSSTEFDDFGSSSDDPCDECGALPGEECALVRAGAKPWCEYRTTPVKVEGAATSAEDLFPS